MQSKYLFFLMSILIAANSVYAQEGHIRLKNEAFKEVEVVNEQGKKEYKLVEPSTAIPGDEILYVTTFTNVSNQATKNIVITNPVPNNSVYKQGSAFGAGTQITFSVDSGKSYANESGLVVSDEGAQRPAKAEEYTDIRWVYQGELAPNAEGTVSFRTIIKKSPRQGESDE